MTVYYNEFDKKKCAALRALMEDGLIAKGDIDDRSINDVRPADLEGYDQCHFFAGIGVWSAALRAAGVPDDFPVWTGSCPCQSFSSAGKRKGFDDERHLWPAWLHLIRVCRPGLVFGEQVASKDGLAWDDLVQADMEGEGYARAALDLCAAGFGAPHIRQRNYWMAYANEAKWDRSLVWSRPDKGGRLADGRTIGELADTTRIGQARIGGSGKNGIAEHSTIDGLANTECNKEHKKQQRSENDERGRRSNSPCRCDTPCRMADTDGGDAGKRSIQHGGQHGQQPENSCACGKTNCRREYKNDGGLSGSSPTKGFWGVVDWLFCRDGKWRPVEPGTFPLAHGYPERVGILHCAGDAIVLPQAQAFVEAGFEYIRSLA